MQIGKYTKQNKGQIVNTLNRRAHGNSNNSNNNSSTVLYTKYKGSKEYNNMYTLNNISKHKSIK